METEENKYSSALSVIDSLIYTFADVDDDDDQINDKQHENAALGQDLYDLVANKDASGLPQRKKKEKRRDRKKNKNKKQKQKINRPKKEKKYEYLDHTAGITMYSSLSMVAHSSCTDIQLHSWGNTMKEAFEQIGVAMFGYMTELETVEYIKSFEIQAKGHDMNSLLFHFLDELLVAFSIEEYLLFKDIEITEFDTKNFVIKAVGFGEHMDLSKHPQGTEVKAITYSAMQVKQNDKKSECWVVVDI